MNRLRAPGVVAGALALTLLLAACSSWDTGSDSGKGPEQACLDMIETFARAAERCGAEYKLTYDDLLQRNANGDCKNVRSIRDEAALRNKCLPFVRTQSCEDRKKPTPEVDPSCPLQLQRNL